MVVDAFDAGDVASAARVGVAPGIRGVVHTDDRHHFSFGEN